MSEELKAAQARIACLEGEIAKRDEELAACRVSVENCELFRARIAELEARIVWLECEAQVNAAPVSEAKAQGSMLQKIGKRLAELLDEDQFAEVEQMLASLNVAPVQQVSVPDGWRDGYRAAMNSAASGARQLYVQHCHHHGADGLLGRCKELEQSFIRDADAMLAAAPAAPSADAGALADAFLSWKLPDSVRPDGCAMDPTYPHRYGTNLMTWAQAKEMFEYVLAETAVRKGEQ